MYSYLCTVPIMDAGATRAPPAGDCDSATTLNITRVCHPELVGKIFEAIKMAFILLYVRYIVVIIFAVYSWI
jgi:hypothetical protein